MRDEAQARGRRGRATAVAEEPVDRRAVADEPDDDRGGRRRAATAAEAADETTEGDEA